MGSSIFLLSTSWGGGGAKSLCLPARAEGYDTCSETLKTPQLGITNIIVGVVKQWN